MGTFLIVSGLILFAASFIVPVIARLIHPPGTPPVKSEEAVAFELSFFTKKASRITASFQIEWTPSDPTNRSLIFQQIQGRATQAILSYASENETVSVDQLCTHVSILLNRSEVLTTLSLHQIWFFVRSFSIDGVQQEIRASGIVIGAGRVEIRVP